MSFSIGFIVVALCVLTSNICAVSAAKDQSTGQKATAKKADLNNQKGLTPFFLQDPEDQSCLGPGGFSQCDENALWMLTKREGKKNTYSLVSFLTPSANVCLQQERKLFGLLKSDKLKLGSCGKNGAKLWDWEFLDQTHVKLSVQGQCLVRGKKTLKNSVSLQPCGKKSKGDFTPLVYHPTAVHENGFFLKAADGQCFDGQSFRSCDSSASLSTTDSMGSVLWGIGIKYVWGDAQRYIFNFSPKERSKCVVAQGSAVVKGDCAQSGALKWGLHGGQLSVNHGAQCVGRTGTDQAVLVPCREGFEHVSLEVPSLYTNDQLLEMLKNPKLSDDDRSQLLAAVDKKASLTGA